MSGALKEVAALFEVKVDDKQLKALDGHLTGATEKLFAFGEVLAGFFAVRAVGEFVESTIKMGGALKDTADKLGVGVEDLQRFQYAAEQVGGSVEGADTALRFFNKNIGAALEGNKEASETFAAMGISLKDAHGEVRPLLDVVQDASDHFQGLGSEQERTNLAMKLFGRGGADMINVLKGGSKGLQELFKQADETGGIIGQDLVDQMDKADDAMNDWRYTLRGLKVNIIANFLPSITHLIDRVRKWVKTFSDLVKRTQFIKMALTALSIVAGIKAVKAFKALGDAMGVLTKAGQGESILGSLFGLGELALIVGGVLILFLLFEDLFNLMKGNKSLIGDILDDLYGAGTAARYADILNAAWINVTKTFDSLGESLDSVGESLVSSGLDGQRAFEIFLDVLTQVINGVSALISMIGHLVAGVLKIPEAIKKGSFDPVGKELGQAFSSKNLTDILGIPAIPLTPAVDLLAGGTTNIPSVVAPRQAKSFEINGRSVQPNITVNVQGTSDPKEAGRLAGQGAKDALNQSDLNNAYQANLQGTGFEP